MDWRKNGLIGGIIGWIGGKTGWIGGIICYIGGNVPKPGKITHKFDGIKVLIEKIVDICHTKS